MYEGWSLEVEDTHTVVTPTIAPTPPHRAVAPHSTVPLLPAPSLQISSSSAPHPPPPPVATFFEQPIAKNTQFYSNFLKFFQAFSNFLTVFEFHQP